jgi:hypothetical protein
MARWQAMMPSVAGPDMVFIIGGFNEAEAYGRVYEVRIPGLPVPAEQNAGSFGFTCGGQNEYVNRLIGGFDSRALDIMNSQLKLTQAQIDKLVQQFDMDLSAPIPFQFLPL